MDVTRTARWLGTLQALLPPGDAISRDPLANVTKLLEAKAAMLGSAEMSFEAWLEQYEPAVAVEMLDDWDRLLGLPDCCDVGAVRTQAQRRIEILEKLTVVGGQSAGYYVDMMARRGVAITVQDLGSNVWKVTTALLNLTVLRVGDRVGMRLRSWGNISMMCRIDRLKPAHTRIVFAYV